MIYENASPHRQRKHRKRRDQILRAASQLVNRNGLDGLTIQRLASELDYTAGALYRYFPSKAALIAALEVHAIENISEHLDKARITFEQSPLLQQANTKVAALARLVGLAEHFVALTKQLPTEIHLINSMMGDQRRFVDNEFVPQIFQASSQVIRPLTGLLNAAEQSKAIRKESVQERTLVLWASLQGITQLDKLAQHYDATTFAPEKIASSLIRSLLLGWGANDNELDAAIKLTADSHNNTSTTTNTEASR